MKGSQVVVVIFALVLLIVFGYGIIQTISGFPTQMAVPVPNQPINTIQNGQPLEVISPRDNVSVQQGTSYTIQWKGGGPNVHIKITGGNQSSPTVDLPTYSNSGSYAFQVLPSYRGTYYVSISDTMYSISTGALTVVPQTSADGWNIYTSPEGDYSFRYPTSFDVQRISEEKNIYPYMPYELYAGGWVDGWEIKNTDWQKTVPSVQVVRYQSNGKDPLSWLEAHENMMKGYSTKTRKVFNNITWTQVWSRRDNRVPDALYLTSYGQYIYGVYLSYGWNGPAQALVSLEDIVRTFKFGR